MQEIMKKVATMAIKLYAMYVFTMAAMLAMMIGAAKPVLGVSGLAVSIIVLFMLRGGKDYDSGRNET